MKDLNYILLHLDKIERGVSKGEIFKTEESTDQRFQLCIFQMLKGRTLINDRYLKELYEKKYRGTKRSTINFDNRAKLRALWGEEIKAHNDKLLKDQTKLDF